MHPLWLRLPAPVEQGTAEPSPHHCHGRRDCVSNRLYCAALRFVSFLLRRLLTTRTQKLRSDRCRNITVHVLKQNGSRSKEISVPVGGSLPVERGRVTVLWQARAR